MKYLNFCLVVFIALLLSAGSVEKKVPSIGYYPGEAMPNIVLTDLEGNTHDLKDYKGKKVVVSMWATYDAQSRADNVLLHNILAVSDEDVCFLSIAFDEDVNLVKRTLDIDDLNNKTSFCEVNGKGSKLYRELKLNHGFRNYLIDEDGIIRAMNFTPQELKTVI